MSKVENWKNKLAESRAGLLDFLAGLEPAHWETIVFSEGNDWTVHTIVGHLIDSEKGMSIHVHKIRKGEETVPEGFDIDRWNAGVKQRVGTPTPGELLAGLKATRAKTLEMMETIKDDEWSLTGRHPSRGVITVEQYYETMYGHELMHTQDMRKVVSSR